MSREERKAMAWWFDGPLLNALTRHWDAAAINEYPERVRKHEESLPAPIVAAMQNIDAKATGLLTHVSMMIAGLGLLAPLVADHRLEQGVIVFEMGVYLLLAIGCLRCLNVFNPHHLTGELGGMSDALGRELLLRRELYAFCVRAAIVVTMAIVVTLPVMYFW
jgi:hypothetical protein